MIRKNKDVRDFFWNAAGLTLNSFNSLFFLIAVKLINGMDEAGIFTYAFSLCCLFYAVAIFYNRTFQVSENGRFDFNDFLSVRLILSGVSILSILIFSIVSGFDFYKISVILLLMGFRVIEAVSDCFYGELHKNGRLDQTGISLFFKAIVGLGVFVGVDLLTHNVLAAVAGLILVNFAVLNLFDIRNFRKLGEKPIKFKTENIKTLLKLSLPIFVFTLLSSFLGNCQKYVLTYFANNETQAIFGMLIMPATVISLAGSYLVNPFLAKFNELKNSKKYKEFRDFSFRLTAIMFGVGVLALIVCGFIGIPVLNFVYQIELSGYWLLLEIIIGGAIFSAMTIFPSTALTVLGENLVQSKIYLITSIASLTLSIILIANFGIFGAVLAFVGTNLVLLIIFMVKYIEEVRKLDEWKEN